MHARAQKLAEEQPKAFPLPSSWGARGEELSWELGRSFLWGQQLRRSVEASSPSRGGGVWVLPAPPAGPEGLQGATHGDPCRPDAAGGSCLAAVARGRPGGRDGEGAAPKMARPGLQGRGGHVGLRILPQKQAIGCSEAEGETASSGTRAGQPNVRVRVAVSLQNVPFKMRNLLRLKIMGKVAGPHHQAPAE